MQTYSSTSRYRVLKLLGPAKGKFTGLSHFDPRFQDEKSQLFVKVLHHLATVYMYSAELVCPLLLAVCDDAEHNARPSCPLRRYCTKLEALLKGNALRK